MKESKNNAKRLLEILKSPFISIASELIPLNSNPHKPVSQQMRRIAMETESLPGGRLAHSDNSVAKSTNQESDRHRIRQSDLLGNHFEPDTGPSQWFQKRKRAAKEIIDLSEGQLMLSPHQLYYRGDDRSHIVTHIKCGYSMKVALSELQVEGPFICPLCHGGLLSRLKHDQINDYVFNISNGQVLFIKNQLLGHTGESHIFFHLGCSQPFSATAEYVIRQNREGISSGCSHCQ